VKVNGQSLTANEGSITITSNTTGSGSDAVVSFVADIKLDNATLLRSAFANNKFGQNIIDTPSNIASEHNGIWAINGDYYGFRSDGILIRNGVIYRDSGTRDGMAFYSDGRVEVYDETTTKAQTLLDAGVWNTLSFGPALVNNSKVLSGIDQVEVDTNVGNHSIQGQQPRTAVGGGETNHLKPAAVHGGGAFDPDHRVFQGFGTGLLTQPSGLDHRGWNEQSADLAHRTDLVRLGLAGNLKDYVMTISDGSVRRGIDLIHNGAPAAFASHPQENVNYVDAHDNETLYDLLAYKLPQGMPVAERVRMNTVCLATVALAQSPAFWSAGTELLRSKSLDRDSYNSGDWFNAIDFTGQSNGFGRGLPPASRNEGSWAIQGPLLQDDWLRPSPEEIAAARSQALDLLRLRASTPLFSLGSARLIQDKLSFPGSGFAAPPGRAWPERA